MKRLAAILVALTLACTHSSPPPEGVVQGVVTDSGGSPLPGATVTLFTTSARTAVTDATGAFRFAGVPAGAYEVRAELPGLLQSSHPVSVGPNRGMSVSLVLRNGAVSEAITVITESPHLTLQSLPLGRAGYRFTSHTVDGAELSVSRSLLTPCASKSW